MDEELKSSPEESNDQNSGGTDTAPTPEGQDNSADTQSSKQAPEQGNLENDSDTNNELVEFGKSRGFSDEEMQSPAVMKALKQARDSKSSADKNFQAKQEAEKKIGTFGKKVDQEVNEDDYSDPLELEIAKLKATDKSRDRKMSTAMFFTMKPDAVPFIEAMDSIAEERPYLYNDLDLLLEIARGRGTDIDSAKDAGRKEAEARLAKGQQAGAPSRSASNSAPQGKQSFTRSGISTMGRAEYEENRAAIVAAEQAGTVVEDI